MGLGIFLNFPIRLRGLFCRLELVGGGGGLQEIKFVECYFGGQCAQIDICYMFHL